ncbi:MAG: DUF2520 domain-containing protein [Legionellaceae bacterium]|nr:DUF2520 domain-containing protein [Legionellaceae bacterium]
MSAANFIGAGRLGLSLARYLLHQQKISIAAICNHSRASSANVVRQLGQGQAVASLAELPDADFYFLTCTDDALPQVARQLADAVDSLDGRVVVHCSGSLESAVLRPLRQKGGQIASLHPLKAFTAAMPLHSWDGVYCTLEGDTDACAALQALFHGSGLRILAMASQHKTLYHAASVCASNYLVTLAAMSQDLFRAAAFPEAQARAVTLALMEQSLENLRAQSSVQEALTGPLARGDLECVIRHLHALHDYPEHRDTYCALAAATLALTALPETLRQSIADIVRPGRRPDADDGRQTCIDKSASLD